MEHHLSDSSIEYSGSCHTTCNAIAIDHTPTIIDRATHTYMYMELTIRALQLPPNADIKDGIFAIDQHSYSLTASVFCISPW